MKLKKLVFLLVLLTLLAGGAILKKAASDKKERSEQLAATVLETVVKSFNEAAVKKLSLKLGESAEGGFTLVRKDDGSWSLPDYFNAHARKWNVDTLLKKIGEAKGEIRSETADVIKDYGLTNEKALHIQALGAQDSLISHLLVGLNRTPSGQNFIRLYGSDRVIVSNDDILLAAGLRGIDAKLDAKSFADMQLARIEVSQAVKIEFTDKKSSWILSKKDVGGTQAWGWDPSEPANEVDPEKVNTLLRSVAGLSAKEVLDPKPVMNGFEAKPWIHITQTKDGVTTDTSLFLGTLDKTKKSYTLRVMPDDIVYEVVDSAIEGVKTDKSGFLKPKK